MTLEDLASQEFALDYDFIDAAPAARRALGGAPLVLWVRRALRDGEITFEDIRSFVTRLMLSLRQGEKFEHDTALCALGVALEPVPAHFSDEFLGGLANLRAPELRRASAVARECLRGRRETVADTTVYVVGAAASSAPFRFVLPTRGNGQNGNYYAQL